MLVHAARAVATSIDLRGNLGGTEVIARGAYQVGIFLGRRFLVRIGIAGVYRSLTHLGKSRIEAVKSPMYATTVGLVLTGYHSLDERSARPSYEEEVYPAYQPAAAYQQPAAYQPPVAPATPAPVAETRPTPAKPAPEPEPAKPKQPSKAGEFFKNILSRTKGLLIDDYDDKSY